MICIKYPCAQLAHQFFKKLSGLKILVLQLYWDLYFRNIKQFKLLKRALDPKNNFKFSMCVEANDTNGIREE
jgi:hypothetical protein